MTIITIVGRWRRSGALVVAVRVVVVVPLVDRVVAVVESLPSWIRVVVSRYVPVQRRRRG
jgi:hypothetical protein